MFTRGLTIATESVLVVSNVKFDQINYLHETFCATWYHLCNLLKACNFTKSNTHQYVFLTFLKLYNWYKIAQKFTYILRINQLFLRHSQRNLFEEKLFKIISSNGWSRKLASNIKWISANYVTFITPEIIKKKKDCLSDDFRGNRSI